MADRRPLLMLIDGPSLVYRGYFALPPLTLSDGTLVNAVFGFLQIVLRGMQDVKPDYAIVSFDIGKPQFRFDAFPDYKRGRPSMPDDLRSQFPIVREIAAMMNIPIRELEGYEADDVIGTLTKRATAAGVDTMIVSGDLDGLQLVDDHVRLLTTRMGVAATVIYDEARVTERYGLRPDQMLDYKALKGDTSDNIPGVPGVGEKTASSLLQQFGTLDGIYEHLDEVKGKLRDRLTEHRESAFMSREVGRIVLDLPVELGLEEARTGRYDRRAVAQRFRELEFRSLIDRLPASSIAPTGYDSPEQDTKGGLQLSLDLLGGKAPSDASAEPAPRPDPLTDPAGAIEHVDPRIVRSPEEMEELSSWLESHGDAIGLGWAVGTGRPLGRRLFGIALAGADGSSWYVPCDPSSIAIERLPVWFARPEPRRVGHDLKQLLVTLAADRGIELQGSFFDTLVAGYMVNPALRSQTIDDMAATRFGATLPDRPLSADTGAEEPMMARRSAAEALTSIFMVSALERELTEGGLANLFDEVEMPLLPVLARMELAGIRIDLDALEAMRAEFAATLAGLESRIYELVGHEFNIGSPRQLETVLFDELELPSTKRTRTSRSTDASVLEELRERHEVIDLILEHRQVSKLKSTYVDALPTLVDGEGRLHTTYQQAIAATGRLSSTDPNLQNIPIRTALGRRIRRAFVAPDRKAAARRRLLAAGAAHPRPRVRRSRLEGGLRGALGHPSRRRRARPAPGGRSGRPEGAERGEDDQLRDRLWAERLRPRRPAADPARRGARLHRGLLRRLPGHPPLHDRDEDPRPRPGLRHDAPRAAAVSAGAHRPQRGTARGGRADGDQHADPGNGSRRHEDRDGPDGCRAPRSRHAVADAPPGPRRARLRDR